MSLRTPNTARGLGKMNVTETNTSRIKDSVYGKLLAKSLPRLIRTEAEHQRATAMLLELDERERISAEEAALSEVLTLLIEDYEEKYHPLPQVPPNESLRALMEDRGLKHKDIWPVLGNKGAATEVLSGRRSISKSQAKRLAEFLRVPVELFI
jgi:HTH-type transcriptional regulator/antitoxin HigA